MGIFLWSIVAMLPIMTMFAVFGCFAVWKEESFFSHSLAHSLLLPILLTSMFNITHTTIGNITVVLFAVFFTLLMSFIKKLSSDKYTKDDILMISSFVFLSLAIAIMNYKQVEYDAMSCLVGDILLVTKSEVLLVYIYCCIVLIFIIKFKNILLLHEINADVATLRYNRSTVIVLLFNVLQAIFIAIIIKIVGLLLLSAAMVMPALIARRISFSAKVMLITAIITAIIIGYAGLFMGLWLNIGITPIIIILYIVIMVLFSMPVILLVP
jgi:zinc transport system permease protein